MYNSQEIADKINFICKRKKILQKTLVKECGLGINAVANLKNGRMMLCDNLAKIADYLDVSVDYLLGRTTIHEINTGNTYSLDNSPQAVQGYNNTMVITQADTEHSERSDSMVDEMLKQFETLSFADKLEIMQMISRKASHE